MEKNAGDLKIGFNFCKDLIENMVLVEVCKVDFLDLYLYGCKYHSYGKLVNTQIKVAQIPNK